MCKKLIYQNYTFTHLDILLDGKPYLPPPNFKLKKPLICTLCLGYMQIWGKTTPIFFFPSHICATMRCVFLIFADHFLIVAGKKRGQKEKKKQKKNESLRNLSCEKKHTSYASYLHFFERANKRFFELFFFLRKHSSLLYFTVTQFKSGKEAREFIKFTSYPTAILL